jgi:hypothetical protein
MMHNNFKSGLRFLIMPTRFVQPGIEKDLSSAYSLWKEVWDFACRQEMMIDAMSSDVFTRQSHLAVLFHKEEPVVLTTLNFLKLNLRMDTDDSYFKVWPQEAMKILKEEASIIYTCGNLALNFNFRRGAIGVSAKDLIFAILVHFLKYSSADAMVAAVRLEKGMEKAAYRTGAHPIYTNLPYSIPGQRVDLVSWHRSLNVKNLDPEIQNLASWIWINKTHIFDPKNFQGEKNVA